MPTPSVSEQKQSSPLLFFIELAAHELVVTLAIARHSSARVPLTVPIERRFAEILGAGMVRSALALPILFIAVGRVERACRPREVAETRSGANLRG